MLFKHCSYKQSFLKLKAAILKPNQNLVQIPFNKFQGIMKYLCERHSIKYVEQEESYTSQASHIHKDFIPTYGKEETESISFSGKRDNRLYRISESSYVNADLNGSANIGRKAFPEYTCTNLLNSEVIIVNHPDKCPDRLIKTM